MNDYNTSSLSFCDLDAVACDTHSPTGRRHPYLNGTYEEIGSLLSMDRTGSLMDILNEEPYDDGRGTLRDPRQKQKPKNVLPSGATNHLRIRLDPKLPADTEDHNSWSGLGQKNSPRTETQTPDGERVKRGARGRPRVRPQDEAAADVSVMRF